MRRSTIVFLLISALSLCKMAAQDSAFYFSSVVLSAVTGQAIPNAKISQVGTLRVTFTDENGCFTILMGKKKSVLEISKPFFKTKFFSTPFLVKPDNKFLLDPYSDDNSEKDSVEKVFKAQDNWVLQDYGFYDKNILLILRNQKTKREKLRVLSSSAAVLDEILLDGKSNHLFRSYTGNYSVLSEDKAKQFLFDGRSILFTSELPLREFEKSFYSYLAEDSANIYFRHNSPNAYYLDHDLKVKIKAPALTYYVIDKKTKRKSLLKNIPNEAVEKGEYGDFLFLDLGLKRLPFYGTGTIFQDVKGPLFKTGKGIVFFDPGNYKAENFDLEGKLILTSNFSFYPGKVWDGNFYLDIITNKFYTIFPNEGTLSCSVLKEINPENGKAGEATKIPGQPVFDLKINNGFVYFLWREISGNISLARVAVKN